MAQQRIVHAGQGLTFIEALALLFIVLKLTHVITWPWGIVLIPVWGVLSLIVAIVIGVVVWEIVKAFVIDPWRENKWRRMRREARRVAKAMNR